MLCIASGSRGAHRALCTEVVQSSPWACHRVQMTSRLRPRSWPHSAACSDNRCRCVHQAFASWSWCTLYLAGLSFERAKGFKCSRHSFARNSVAFAMLNICSTQVAALKPNDLQANLQATYSTFSIVELRICSDRAASLWPSPAQYETLSPFGCSAMQRSHHVLCVNSDTPACSRRSLSTSATRSGTSCCSSSRTAAAPASCCCNETSCAACSCCRSCSSSVSCCSAASLHRAVTFVEWLD